jgi:hypothetical protein
MAKQSQFNRAIAKQKQSNGKAIAIIQRLQRKSRAMAKQSQFNRAIAKQKQSNGKAIARIERLQRNRRATLSLRNSCGIAASLE